MKYPWNQGLYKKIPWTFLTNQIWEALFCNEQNCYPARKSHLCLDVHLPGYENKKAKRYKNCSRETFLKCSNFLLHYYFFNILRRKFLTEMH